MSFVMEKGTPALQIGLAALLALASCGGGGGGSSAPVWISFASATATLAEDASSASVEVVLHTSLPALVDPASVEVADAGTGTALASSDFAAFALQTITFPPGSLEGDTQSVTIQLLDDTSLESDETVQLGLLTPSAGVALGAPSQHALSILDDDGPLFIGTEGLDGTGNALAYDEVLSLGVQIVGAGPNAGTLVRIANGGVAPMNLGAPSVTGLNSNDFAVEIETSTTPLAGIQSALLAPDIWAPLLALESDGLPGVRLALDGVRLAELAPLQRSTWHGVVVPALGPLTLELVRRPLPISADCVLRVDGEDVPGGVRTLIGDLQLWTGTAREFPGSEVFLALSSSGVQGFIEFASGPERLVHLVPDQQSERGALVVRALLEPEFQALGMKAPAEICAGERFVPGRALATDLAALPPPQTSALTVADCRLAIETDTQLFLKFASSTELATYVTELIAAVGAQYFTDVQATLSIAYLGIHTGANDGWAAQETVGSDAGTLLDEFQATWGSSWPVQADLAHFLSGAALGGGVAYVNVLCNQGFGFGVSADLTGTIDWSTWTGQSAGFTWDFVVVAHEIGHNFGSQHTHSYCPPLDQCAANCNGTTNCPRGTIMSYCHTCGGFGLSNIDLVFHPVCANFMRQNINSSCLGEAALAGGDYVQYLLRFNPLTSTGARNATLSFTHSGVNELQPFRVQLTGTGL